MRRAQCSVKENLTHSCSASLNYWTTCYQNSSLVREAIGSQPFAPAGELWPCDNWTSHSWFDDIDLEWRFGFSWDIQVRKGDTREASDHWHSPWILWRIFPTTKSSTKARICSIRRGLHLSTCGWNNFSGYSRKAMKWRNIQLHVQKRRRGHFYKLGWVWLFGTDLRTVEADIHLRNEKKIMKSVGPHYLFWISPAQFERPIFSAKLQGL